MVLAVLSLLWWYWPETPPPIDYAGPVADWPAYGGNQAGERFSALTQIRPANVRFLERAWEYHSGDISTPERPIRYETAYEMTPLLLDRTLYGCSPTNKVFALDPETGQERWMHDPQIDMEARYANQMICRGVAAWVGPKIGVCSTRILTATNDSRLIALDAETGALCPDFGEGGQVDLKAGVGPMLWAGEYQVTSAPAVIRDVVVVGSAVNDNGRIDAPSGVVRGYDVQSGALRWAWDPVPEGYQWLGGELPSGFEYTPGTANVWGPMSVDEARDLVFLPTGNTAPDYYGGHRDAIETFASSVVALRGSTGEVVWSYQTVHHDLWDFDVPAQPTLTTLRRDGREIPAVIQATKMGMLFVLHRETGEPLFPVEERPVPQSGVEGERLSPTQPFPLRPPPLVPHELSPEDAWGLTPWDRAGCREKFEALHFEGIYTPPTLQGTLMYPGNAGGSNWGGVAVDAARQIVVANVMNLAWAVTLFPSQELQQWREANPGVEIAPQRGTPYGMMREMLMSSLGIPCNPPPWGTLAAVDLEEGEILWQVPIGTIRDIAPIPLPIKYGVPNLGGPLITASGLIFLGATSDDYLRAFDLETGEELWKARLPAGGQATPMTYRLDPDGKQYVVIAAGGHARADTTLGDSLIAFSLRE